MNHKGFGDEQTSGMLLVYKLKITIEFKRMEYCFWVNFLRISEPVMT